jgi:two-component system, OmpR family, sensor histidine kinase KdpD
MSVRDFAQPAARSDPDIARTTGTLRVYLGVAAGAGTTCAMLDEGHRLLKAGTDVVAGYVDCHGRTRTEERAAGIESIPPKVVRYRDCWLEEMNLDALLARHPAVALIDELAHGNVPGSGRHDKRWQDVQELLAAGIDVITTVNVQHLDSAAGAVERLSGRAVRERVPDAMVRGAAGVELVDCSPERLRRRILRGEVYAGLDIPRALAGFFLPDNLAGLRELARRFLAGDTEQELLEALRDQENASSAEGAERFMVGVTPEPGMAAVMRRAWRLAAHCGADLHVVHIRTGDNEPLAEHDELAPLRRLAVDLGATWIEIADYDAAGALVTFARQRRITHIVLASGRVRRGGRWRGPGGPVVQRVLRQATPAGIDVHVMTMPIR